MYDGLSQILKADQEPREDMGKNIPGRGCSRYEDAAGLKLD